MTIDAKTLCEYILSKEDCSYECMDESYVSIRTLYDFLEDLKLLGNQQSTSVSGSELLKLSEENQNLKRKLDYYQDEWRRLDSKLNKYEELICTFDLEDDLKCREITEEHILEVLRDSIAKKLTEIVKMNKEKIHEGSTRYSLRLLVKKPAASPG